MNTALLLVAAIVVLGSFYVLLPLAAHTFSRYRRRRVVTCPETGKLAEVNIDSRRAAFSSLFGKPRLGLKNCSLWPKKPWCKEGCVKC